MKDKPTTFELAQLAAQAAPPNTRPKDAVRRAMELWREAELEIAEHENRAEYVRCLFGTDDNDYVPVFDDTPEQWTVRLKGYPGDEADVMKALWDKEFDTLKVEKRLFRDRALARDTRHQLFLGLIRVSILNDMPGPRIANTNTIDYLEEGGFLPAQTGYPIHPKNVERAQELDRGYGPKEIPANEVWFVKQLEEVLSKPKLNAHQVRWAVEARQKQLDMRRSRDIPQSQQGPQPEQNQDESIQYKRPHRE